jgi:hypothetical protein
LWETRAGPELRGRSTTSATTMKFGARGGVVSLGGTNWTIELHKFDRGTALGRTADWISSSRLAPRRLLD